jgi:ubiquinone/menaquinone biosynthesis C-methylase UbiE
MSAMVGAPHAGQVRCARFQHLAPAVGPGLVARTRPLSHRKDVFHPEGPTFFELARQALSSTERGYDLLAHKFDYTPFRTPDTVIEAVLACLPEQVDDALDVCCGTGAAMAHLRSRVRERLVGVDLSRGMLARARERLVEHAEPQGDNPQIELERADALELPFESAFDLVVSFGAFGHIRVADEARLVDSIHRALRPGGRFMFASAPLPPLLSAGRLLAHGFNAAMRVRNALWRPQFVMYYLTFMLPACVQLLERHGFEVEVSRLDLAPPFHQIRAVVATKSSNGL